LNRCPSVDAAAADSYQPIADWEGDDPAAAGILPAAIAEAGGGASAEEEEEEVAAGWLGGAAF
jgi:hypothetical protein